jgi:hypothetical protein
MSKVLLSPETVGEIDSASSSRGNMLRAKPEASGEISPLSLVYALVPMACGLQLVPVLVAIAFGPNPMPTS